MVKYSIAQSTAAHNTEDTDAHRRTQRRTVQTETRSRRRPKEKDKGRKKIKKKGASKREFVVLYNVRKSRTIKYGHILVGKDVRTVHARLHVQHMYAYMYMYVRLHVQHLYAYMNIMHAPGRTYVHHLWHTYIHYIHTHS